MERTTVQEVSGSTTAEEADADLEPGVDGELVREMEEYSLRKDDEYIEGTITTIKEEYGRIAVGVELPTDSFTEVFQKPTPESNRFEEFAKHYGTGLVDVSDLKGQSVWCTKDDGDWVATVRRERSTFDIFADLYSSMDGWSSILIKVLLSPVVALGITHKLHQSNTYSFTERPSDNAVGYSVGVYAGVVTTLMWAVILLFII